MKTIKQNLIEMFELDKMEPEKAGEMAERLGKLVFQAVLVRVLPMLTKSEMTEYEKLLTSEQGGEALFSFFGEKVPGFEDMIAEEAQALHKQMSGEFESAGM